jgi:3',5'-cyclic AMP phosphodiesterase CpdA
MSTFTRLLLETDNLTVVATDDYSSFYFHKQNYLISDLRLTPVHIGPIVKTEVLKYLTAVAPPDKAASRYLDGVAETVVKHTGGHTGLAQELLGSLRRNLWPPLGAELELCVNGALKTSVVLEVISQALEEDAEGYARTALELRSSNSPESSPRVHVLRQLGVLQREDHPEVRLCPGAITRLVEGLAHAASIPSSRRIGTIVTESGPRIFEGGPGEPTDDDLVIVHLSDLHVGEHYKHRLTWTGGQANPNEQSAAELLRDDLQSIGLLGRVDGIVLSGDFVWNGSSAEFRRAQTVIEDTLREINLDIGRAIFIPGNHDIEWNPGALSSTSYGNPVSRESYDDFLRLLLGKTAAVKADRLEIESRSHKAKLLIVGLDSNRVEGPNSAGIGFVSREALTTASQAITQFRQASVNGVQSLVWLTVHHHVFPATSTPLAEAQDRIVSTMANAAEVLQFANQWKIEVILHGHEHQPSVTVARRWPVDVGDVFNPVASIGAGSFGVRREYLGPFSRNHYYVIVRRADGVLIRSRQQGSGGVKFVAHSDMLLPR